MKTVLVGLDNNIAIKRPKRRTVMYVVLLQLMVRYMAVRCRTVRYYTCTLLRE
jgi:hypothetical protein